MTLRILLASTLLLVLAGCGGNTNPRGRLPITGQVTLKGEPLKSGTIYFTPTDINAGLASGGKITDGKYNIATEEGLPPGTYIVRISAASEVTDTVEAGGDAVNVFAKELIPPEYNSKTKQSVEVKSGQDNNFDYKID